LTISSDQGEYSVAVVVPSWNEAQHIASVIASMPSWVDAIIVVDDASADGTGDAALSVADARLTVVRHEVNSGVGGAMVTGYRAALDRRFDIVAKMDADGQMQGDELRRLVRPLVDGLAEYTKGNRFLAIRGEDTMPQLRRFGSFGLSFLTKMSSGYWHVFDSQCGFTAVTANALRAISLDDLARDYFFENDMLISLNERGARVVDVPITTFYGSETSGMRISRVLLTFPLRLLLAGWRRVAHKYFVIDFGAIGALLLAGSVLVAFGLIFGGYHWWRSEATGVVASTGTVMLAVLPLIVGVQALIQGFAIEVADSPGAVETRACARRLMSLGGSGQ
jgi:glycosyltransferase involved in cell wall biosynthesis